MHPIRQYRKTARITQQEFGALIGKSQARVSQWEAGERIEAEDAVAIEEATSGATTRNTLRPELFGEAANG